MNRKIPYDRGLIAIVLTLLGFGLIMVFSASTVVSAELYGSQDPSGIRFDHGLQCLYCSFG
jgi:cell division protein FtsW (lipid II flippase)